MPLKKKVMEPIESKYLGKRVSFPQQYDPSLILAIPRYENRKLYDIKEQPEIFTGCDIWHSYELGFITKNGLPVTGMLKITYNSDNLYLVESKSLKLYLNSFNMSRFGDTVKEGLDEVIETIKSDLSSALQTNVNVCFFNTQQEETFDFIDYSLLEENIEAENLTFDHYKESPELLRIEKGEPSEIKVATNLLRSNCKITHQPDWGSVYIHIKANNTIDKLSLLQYLVSFRNEYHFHEEVCEMIYKRLWDFLKPEELMVACLFTRRGGIDICPVRTNKQNLLPKNLINVNLRDCKLIRQ